MAEAEVRGVHQELRSHGSCVARAEQYAHAVTGSLQAVLTHVREDTMTIALAEGIGNRWLPVWSATDPFVAYEDALRASGEEMGED